MAKNPYEGTPYDAFAKMIPGFDFLEGLVKNAGSTLPQIGQWVAPTLDPEELDKRIKELRTVQFWLEQNARMLAATIQALEVQRMTLSTLKTMNVQMTDLRDTLTARPDEAVRAAHASFVPSFTPPAPASKPADSAPPEASPRDTPDATKAESPAASGDAPSAVDPMQWWGALTQQFTQLATSAMKDTAAEAAKKFTDAIPKAAAAAQAAKSPPAPAVAKKAAAPAPARKKAAPAKAARKRWPAVGKA